MKKVIFFAVFIVVGVSLTYYYTRPREEKLPVINPVDVHEELIDPEILRRGYGHKVGSFSFKNQEGRVITESEVLNRVYVVEYFFTTCKSICPVMNKQMQRVHKAFRDEEDFRVLSFTVDPEVDTVERMRVYAEEHGFYGIALLFSLYCAIIIRGR